MSIYQDRIDPNDPLYYAPLQTREQQIEPKDLTHPVPITEFADERMPYDAVLEQAVAKALSHPLDPVFLDPPPDIEESRLETLLIVGGRISAALVIAACAVAFFTFVIPGSRSLPTAEQIMSSLWPAKSRTSEFQTTSSTDASGGAALSRSNEVSPEQAEKLLQQFVQWQQKPASTLGQAK
jgi:hypothetical protein